MPKTFSFAQALLSDPLHVHLLKICVDEKIFDSHDDGTYSFNSSFIHIFRSVTIDQEMHRSSHIPVTVRVLESMMRTYCSSEFDDITRNFLSAMILRVLVTDPAYPETEKDRISHYMKNMNSMNDAKYDKQKRELLEREKLR